MNNLLKVQPIPKTENQTNFSFSNSGDDIYNFMTVRLLNQQIRV